MKLTLIFVLLCCIALSYAVPAPKDINKEAPEHLDELKDGEEEKDLKGSESVYHGWYGGAYPYYPTYSYYSSIYHTPSYWGYAYRPYSYWW